MSIKDTNREFKTGVMSSDLLNNGNGNENAATLNGGNKIWKGMAMAPRKLLIPMVKLGEKATYRLWERTPYPVIAVRMEDMLREDGRKFNRTFDDIIDAGGIHQYLDCPGKVILSTIMRDKLIAGSTPDTYIQAIRALKPEFCTTPDGETYEHETDWAAEEIDRMMSWTREIAGKCPDTTLLGLVKGSNVHQVLEHADRLAGEGISDMVLHVGDFLCRGSHNEMHRAQLYAREVNAKNYNLYVYGIGAGRHLRSFFFADGFITQSHIVSTYKRQVYDHGRWRRTHRKGGRDTIMGNLAGMYDYLRRLENESFWGWN